MKTKVEIIENMRYSDSEIGNVGYIDGYTSINGNIYALVVLNGQIKEYLIRMLKVI